MEPFLNLNYTNYIDFFPHFQWGKKLNFIISNIMTTYSTGETKLKYGRINIYHEKGN